MPGMVSDSGDTVLTEADSVTVFMELTALWGVQHETKWLN